MIIGIPREVKNNENRVSIMPAGVNELVREGHKVLIEKGAGTGSMISDPEYEKYGAIMLDTPKQVYEEAEMILKVKEPVEAEYRLLQRGQSIFTYLHLAANEPLIKVLLEKEITAVAYETVEEKDGSLPLLRPMSEVAGRMSVIIGANLLTKYNGGMGVLLGGIPGVKPAHVVIAGAGTVGINAAKMAVGLGANVTMFDISHKRLAEIDDIFYGKINTVLSSSLNIEEETIKAELFIGAVLLHGKKAPHVLTEECVKQMKKGSVIIDVAIDQGGSVETIDRTTTHDKPTYEKYGVLHYAVPNMPGAVPRTSTIGLTGVTLPYVRLLAEKGVIDACSEDQRLQKGLNTYRGEIINKDLSASVGFTKISG